MENKKLKKRLNDFKHRIWMFGCIYQIMKDEELFYIKDKQLKDSSVKADYIKYAMIDNKGANVGIRYFENQYIAYTMLIDRSINPVRLMTLQKSILHLRTFCPGVFFCKNCGRINKEDFTYKILLSSDYQEVNKSRKFLYFMEFELQCIMMIIIRRIFMQSIMEIRQLLKLIQLDASRELCHQDN